MVWSRSAVQKIRDAVQYVDSLSRNTPDGRAARPVPQSPEIRILDVTSTTADGDGYWPANLKTYTVGTGFSTDSAVVTTTLDGSTPTTGKQSGMWVGSNSSGTPLFLLLGDGAAASGGGSITVEEVDGSPSYSSIDTLIFDQTDGFVVSQPAAGQARVDIQSASTTQAGIVDTTTQSFAGVKTFYNDVIIHEASTGGLLSQGNLYMGPTELVRFYTTTGGGTAACNATDVLVVVSQNSGYPSDTRSLSMTLHGGFDGYAGGYFELHGAWSTDLSAYPQIALVNGSNTTVSGQTGTYAGMVFTSGLLTGGSFTGGSGTVTSIDCTVPSGLSVSGVPITGSGTIAISWNLTADRLLGSDGAGAFQQVTVAARLSYSGGSLDLATTGVTAGTYASVGVDVYGRVTSGSTTLDATNLHFSASSRIAGRKTGVAGAGEECTISEVLDFIGSTAQGDLLYRDASAWARLAAGTAGYVLKTGGAGANPSWSAFAASQSDQELQTSNTVAVTPAVQQYHPSAAKAWAYVDGRGTASVLAGYNTTLTDNGTGDYTLVWGTDFSSANYAVLLTVNNTGSAEFTAVVDNAGTNQAAGSTRLWTITLAGALIDARFYAAAFGDQ